jgi:elongation factor G
MGDVMGDFTRRRAQIEGIEHDVGNARKIHAVAPLSEMFGYSNDLRSRTQGRAVYTMVFSHYAHVSAGVANEIMENTGSLYRFND